MIELNEQQVLSIEKMLEEQGLNKGPLKEELLDHVCCQVERAMEEGASYQDALQRSLDAFQEDEMKELQTHFLTISNQKNALIMKLSLLVAPVLFLLIFFHFNRQNFSEEKQPPSVAFPELIPSIRLTEPPSECPLKGDCSINSSFGMRLHPITKVEKLHRGIDIIAPKGTPVYAAARGIVVKTKESQGGYGQHIVIRHDETYQTLYSQLSRMDVKVGQEVQKGEQIGAVGSSGASTGPHLHYEVIMDGEPVDPEDYLRP